MLRVVHSYTYLWKSMTYSSTPQLQVSALCPSYCLWAEEMTSGAAQVTNGMRGGLCISKGWDHDDVADLSSEYMAPQDHLCHANSLKKHQFSHQVFCTHLEYPTCIVWGSNLTDGKRIHLCLRITKVCELKQPSISIKQGILQLNVPARTTGHGQAHA